ncbi:MAG: PKD domain-containing protein [Myxococcales bacterium]|nr:PKD domain-containing protein [Myxococcales bacterium]
MGDAPAATVVFTNESVDAESYAWEFGPGAASPGSSEALPAPLAVDRAGELSVTLTVTNEGGSSTVTESVTIAGHSAIDVITDLEFGTDEFILDYGRNYSFETGVMYSDAELDETTVPLIDLIFEGYTGETFFFFASPGDYYPDEGGRPTKIDNYTVPGEEQLSADEFKAMADDALLAGLTIEHMEEANGYDGSEQIVLFETADGRKGAILLKALNAMRMLVDIKMQRYGSAAG